MKNIVIVEAHKMEELKEIILELLTKINDKDDEKFLKRIIISLREYVKEKPK